MWVRGWRAEPVTWPSSSAIGTRASTRCWTTGIITLRCYRASNRWDQIWPQPSNQIATTTAA